MIRTKQIVVTCLFLTACSPLYPLTVTTSQRVVARDPKCDFQVLAFEPVGVWDEVGILSAERETDDPAKLKAAVQADVCGVGGEAVVTQVSAAGTYVRGVILRRARMVGTTVPAGERSQ